jgi:hypothetical protein
MISFRRRKPSHHGACDLGRAMQLPVFLFDNIVVQTRTHPGPVNARRWAKVERAIRAYNERHTRLAIIGTPSGLADRADLHSTLAAPHAIWTSKTRQPTPPTRHSAWVEGLTSFETIIQVLVRESIFCARPSQNSLNAR